MVPLDQYGGRLDAKTGATGFFYVKKTADRWWLVDPDGGEFIHVGVVEVAPGRSAAMQAALNEKFG